MPFSHSNSTAAARARLACAPRRRAVARLAAAGLAAVLLGGCTSAPAQPPSATPTASAAEPIFASDEEALAAAVEAYERYVAIVNTIAAEGNDNPARIESVVSASYAAEIETNFAELAGRGLRIEGETTADSFRLLERVEAESRAEIAMLLCSDVSRTRILNASGADATPPNRPERSALQVKLVSRSDDPRTLLVDEEEPWSGDYC